MPDLSAAPWAPGCTARASLRPDNDSMRFSILRRGCCADVGCTVAEVVSRSCARPLCTTLRAATQRRELPGARPFLLTSARSPRRCALPRRPLCARPCSKAEDMCCTVRPHPPFLECAWRVRTLFSKSSHKRMRWRDCSDRCDERSGRSCRCCHHAHVMVHHGAGHLHCFVCRAMPLQRTVRKCATSTMNAVQRQCWVVMTSTGRHCRFTWLRSSHQMKAAALRIEMRNCEYATVHAPA